MSDDAVRIRTTAIEQDVETFRASTRRWLFGSFNGWLTLLSTPIGLGIVVFLSRWWRNLGTRYRLTDQRLVISTGIFLKRVDEIELFRVKDVVVDFSLLNQLADIGTVTLRSSDATTRRAPYALRDVPHARELRETLRTLVDQARRRRRVREIDVEEEPLD